MFPDEGYRGTNMWLKFVISVNLLGLEDTYRNMPQLNQILMYVFDGCETIITV